MCGGDQPAARPGSTRSVSNRVRPDNPDSASRAGAGRALAEVVARRRGRRCAGSRAAGLRSRSPPRCPPEGGRNRDHAGVQAAEEADKEVQPRLVVQQRALPGRATRPSSTATARARRSSSAKLSRAFGSPRTRHERVAACGRRRASALRVRSTSVPSVSQVILVRGRYPAGDTARPSATSRGDSPRHPSPLASPLCG